jgi:hypothetical protein
MEDKCSRWLRSWFELPLNTLGAVASSPPLASQEKEKAPFSRSGPERTGPLNDFEF